MRLHRIVALGGLAAASALAADPPLGEGLYFGTRAFTSPPQVAGAPLPQRDAACVRCHGAQAEGGAEGIWKAPSLVAPGQGPVVLARLRNALVNGVSSQGRPMSPAMPRYAVTELELAALADQVVQLGKGEAPARGVDALRVRLALDLAQVQRAEARADIEAGLREVFDAINRDGGIHGRQIELDASPGAADHALALVGSAPSAARRDSLARLRLPNLASVALEREDAAPAGWTRPLLPSLEAQARLAVSALDELGSDCVKAVVDPTGLMPPPEAGQPPRWPGAGRNPACLAWLAPVEGHSEAWRLWVGSGAVAQPPLAQDHRSLVALGVFGMSLPPNAPARVRWVLAVPRAVADAAARSDRSIWFVLGQAAARATAETLARAGRALQPESLLLRYGQLTGFETLPGAPMKVGPTHAHAWAPTVWEDPTPGR